MTVQIQNVVASAAFNQTFDLITIANAFPENTEFKGRFPGLIFKTGKMVCTGGKGENEASRAILGAARKLRKEGINVTRKPEIQITNIVASATLNGIIDLDKLYSSEGMGGNILFEPEQFPALIYRWESPKVIFLVFSTGKIVCVGARKEKDIYEAIEKLQRKLEESEVLIRS